MAFDSSISKIDIFYFLVGKIFDLMRGIFRTLFMSKTCLCFLGRSIRLQFCSRIVIGRWASIGSYCVLSGLGRDGLYIGRKTSIGAFCRIVVSTTLNNPGAYIKIGDRVGIGEYSSLGGSGGLSIGNNTIIAQYFSAHPENHNFDDLSKPIREQGTTRAAIAIGNDCWIGAKVTVLAGVTIGNGVVVGAGSVVTKSIPDNAIVVGNPARIVKYRGQ